MGAHFSPPGKILWDTWFIRAGDLWHMFFLQAPESLQSNPLARHHYSSIGHATSPNLREWEYHGTALAPGEETAWDDLSLWTGSVFKHEEKFLLFYSGRSRGDYWRQDIGLAISDDLISWRKEDKNPLLSSDGEIYSNDWNPDARKVPPAWRDPFICFNPATRHFYMLFCARTKGPDELYNGCIGLARSMDMLNWELAPPILAPERYAEMEVPQLLQHEENWYLFFSTKPENYDPEWAQQFGAHHGLHVYTSPSLEQPFEPVGPAGTVQFNEGAVYNARILKDDNGKLLALGWLEFSNFGVFQGSLSNLYTLELSPDSVRTRLFSPS